MRIRFANPPSPPPSPPKKRAHRNTRGRVPACHMHRNHEDANHAHPCSDDEGAMQDEEFFDSKFECPEEFEEFEVRASFTLSS